MIESLEFKASRFIASYLIWKFACIKKYDELNLEFHVMNHIMYGFNEFTRINKLVEFDLEEEDLHEAIEYNGVEYFDQSLQIALSVMPAYSDCLSCKMEHEEVAGYDELLKCIHIIRESTIAILYKEHIIKKYPERTEAESDNIKTLHNFIVEFTNRHELLTHLSIDERFKLLRGHVMTRITDPVEYFDKIEKYSSQPEPLIEHYIGPRPEIPESEMAEGYGFFDLGFDVESKD